MTTAKNPVVKKTLKPLTPGVKVRVTRRNGEVETGKVHSTEDRVNGRWITVNVAAARQPEKLVSAREKNVIRA